MHLLKKIILLNCTLLFLPLVTIASPTTLHQVIAHIECPNTEGGPSAQLLTNYGTYLNGMGIEIINNEKTYPTFHGLATPSMPLDLNLGKYTHSHMVYNGHNGKVTCYFKSAAKFPDFNVSYSTDFKHAIVTKSDGVASMTFEVVQS